MTRFQFAAATIALLLLGLAPDDARADTGLYIGGSAGGASYEVDLGPSSFPGLPTEFDEDDSAFKVFGGFNFDLPVIDLGVEAAYVNFGEPEFDLNVDRLTVETTGVTAFGVAALEVGPFDVFGKLGVLAWDVEAALDSIGETDSDDGTDVAYGIGARFGVGPLQIRGEYEIFEVDDETDLTMVSVGIAFFFN